MMRTLFTRCGGYMRLHTTPALRIDPKTVEEIRIPVPWGHIAGKWWGPKEGPLTLAVHGWQDNAGSWDPLLERLPHDHSVVALDMPGNGISSHFPPFIVYSFLESPSILKRVVNYLNRGKVNLIGHSGGSAVCFIYSCIFPEDVNSYFGIDYLAHCYKREETRVSNLAKNIDKFITLALRDPKKARSNTWEDAKEKWVAATRGSLNPISGEILMQRGVTKLPDGRVVFSRDNRVKASNLNQVQMQQTLNLIKDYKTKTCLIRGTQSDYFYDKGIKYFPDILDILKNQCDLFEYHEVEGNHHLHMDIPEETAKIYLSFLDKVNAST